MKQVFQFSTQAAGGIKEIYEAIEEEYEREIERIRAEENTIKRNALLFEARANLYIWQHVCHVFEEEVSEQ